MADPGDTIPNLAPSGFDLVQPRQIQEATFPLGRLLNPFSYTMKRT